MPTLANTAPWSGLIGVPAGFADNVDNDTTYTTDYTLTSDGNAAQHRADVPTAAGMRSMTSPGGMIAEDGSALRTREISLPSPAEA